MKKRFTAVLLAGALSWTSWSMGAVPIRNARCVPAPNPCTLPTPNAVDCPPPTVGPGAAAYCGGTVGFTLAGGIGTCVSVATLDTCHFGWIYCIRSTDCVIDTSLEGGRLTCIRRTMGYVTTTTTAGCTSGRLGGSHKMYQDLRPVGPEEHRGAGEPVFDYAPDQAIVQSRGLSPS